MLLGVRDSSYFSLIMLLSSVHGSLLMVQCGCSEPSHHICIPANRKEEDPEECTTFLKDTSIYMPLARTQGYGCYLVMEEGWEMNSLFWVAVCPDESKKM